MLQSLLLQQKQSIDFFFERLNHFQAENMLGLLENCVGSLVFLGIGKSGKIAEKIAATFSSIGVRSCYIDSLELIHGDLGKIQKGDLCILLSKSGETKELLTIIPYLRQKQVKILAWISQENSSLQKLVDETLILPLDRELCPFNLAPTISSEVQLLFGDLMAVALMRKKKMTLEEYAGNHPAGTIGRLGHCRVEEVMLPEKEVPICYPKDKLKEVLVELSNKKCGCLIVIDEDKVVQGVFTDGDLRRALQKEPGIILEEMMENLMTKKFVAIEKRKSLHEAAQVMQKQRHQWVSVLPVVQDKKLVGLIRLHDVVGANL